MIHIMKLKEQYFNYIRYGTKEYEITNDNMQMRYTNMTNNPELFNVISNTFNADFVNLKDKNKHLK